MRRIHARRIAVAGLIAAVALSGCSSSTQGDATASGSPKASTSGTDRTYDVSGVKKVDAIANLLPAEVKTKGKITIGAAIDYAPAEFRADDLLTAIGYDVDFGKALGKVLGVQTEVSAAEFASILPGIGTKYDIGISSFTIAAERTANYNMVSYITVGSSFAVQKGNPKNFNADEICGQSIGVQTGTWQEKDLGELSKKCVAAGKKAVETLSYATQSDVTTNLAGGKIIAMYADSTVSDYAVTLTNGQLQTIGGVRDAAPQGVVIAQKDKALTEAIQKAVQQLMDDGTWNKILANWGIKDAMLTKAEINPKA